MVCATSVPLLINIWSQLVLYFACMVLPAVSISKKYCLFKIYCMKEDIFQRKQVHTSAMMSSIEQSLRDLWFNNFWINFMRSFWIAVFLHVENNTLFWAQIFRIFERFETLVQELFHKLVVHSFGGRTCANTWIQLRNF